jgi:hypothetical protein
MLLIPNDYSKPIGGSDVSHDIGAFAGNDLSCRDSSCARGMGPRLITRPRARHHLITNLWRLGGWQGQLAYGRIYLCTWGGAPWYRCGGLFEHPRESSCESRWLSFNDGVAPLFLYLGLYGFAPQSSNRERRHRNGNEEDEVVVRDPTK